MYRAELKQGRVPAACLYTESEFKDLVIEAHYNCRYHYWQNPSVEKRYYYWCKYCHQDFSDKNAISYHRYRDLCKTWRKVGKGVLKMYPTFHQSQRGASKDLLEEAGLTFPAEEGKRPWNPRDSAPCGGLRPLHESQPNGLVNTSRGEGDRFEGVTLPTGCNVVQGVVKDAVKVKKAEARRVKGGKGTVAKAGHAHEEGQKKEDTKRMGLRHHPQDDCEEGKSKHEGEIVEPLRPKKLKLAAPTAVRFQPHRSDVGPSSSTEKDYVSQFCNPEHIDEEVGVVEGAALSPVHGVAEVQITKGQGLTKPLELLGALGEVCSVLPLPGEDSCRRTMLSRERVRVEAERYAASLTADAVFELGPPPKPQPIAGLYHLLHESPKDIIVERALLHDPSVCMEALEKLEERGELGARIMAAIGPWVAWREAQVRQTKQNSCSAC